MARKMNIHVAVAVALCATTTGVALADEPSFVFVAPEKIPEAKWSANMQAGLNLTAGNAFGLGLSGSGALARKSGGNRIGAEVSGSFARTRVEFAADTNGVPGIGPGEVRTVVQTTTAAWATKLRYDRFFGPHHSVYGSASAAADHPAGKHFIGGFQLGYSRELLRRAYHALTLEAGYDFAHQSYVALPDSVTIQSARLFAAYQWTPSPDATLSLGAELLTNLAPENTPTGRASPFVDNRLNGRTELSLKVNEHGRLAVRVRARYDSHPAPKPPPPGASWEPGFTPLADRLDTQTELLFVYQFL